MVVSRKAKRHHGLVINVAGPRRARRIYNNPISKIKLGQRRTLLRTFQRLVGQAIPPPKRIRVV